MDTKSLLPYSLFGGSGREVTPFTALQREMDRLFGEFGRTFPTPAIAAAVNPKVDITETDGQIRVTAELPGLTEKDVEVTFADDVLTIRGEKKEETEEGDADRHLTERSYGAFSRAFRLPPGLNPDQVAASFDKGVLTVTLPKPAEAQARVRKIDVKPAG